LIFLHAAPSVSWLAGALSEGQVDPVEHLSLEYSGEGHAIGGAEANAHAVQSAVGWLLARLKPE